MVGGQPKTNIDDQKFRVAAQLGKEGVSVDYCNKSMFSSMGCKALLHKPGFEVDHYADSEIELRKKILEEIKNFPSYTEYKGGKDKISGVDLLDFLTERGKKIVARLDQIALELRGFYVEDPQMLDVNHALTLLEESNELVHKQ